jgi:hypothetical protein
VVRFILNIPNLPRDLSGVTIAHVSDMHVGPFTMGDVVQQMVESVNSLRADIRNYRGPGTSHEYSRQYRAAPPFSGRFFGNRWKTPARRIPAGTIEECYPR